jgi:hypothetical protein
MGSAIARVAETPVQSRTNAGMQALLRRVLEMRFLRLSVSSADPIAAIITKMVVDRKMNLYSLCPITVWMAMLARAIHSNDRLSRIVGSISSMSGSATKCQ